MRSPIRLSVWALAVALLLGATIRAGAEPEPVVITLRPSATVTASPVCVRHVATLSGGSAALREQIAGLDLADRPGRGKSLTQPRELVAYRIQVAGIERGRFETEGAPAVRVSPGPGSVTADDFLQAAR
jgi:hypothetical protein